MTDSQEVKTMGPQAAPECPYHNMFQRDSDELEARVRELEVFRGRAELNIETMNTTLNGMDKKIDKINSRPMAVMLGVLTTVVTPILTSIVVYYITRG